MNKRKKTSKRPSMQDVANIAGVSQTTVSFVVNNVETANIPAETQERVRDAMRELRYRPNATARHLRSSRTQTIGFIGDVIATTPHAGRIIQGAQDFAWAHGYLMLVVNTGGNREVRDATIDMLLERRVDGLLYATMYHRSVSPPEVVKEVPTVLLDCFVEDRSLPSVVPDEVKGGYMATKHLIDAGHRRIGFINNSDDIPAAHGRLQGYRNALEEAGIAFDGTLVSATSSTSSGGHGETKRFMALSDPPTGLFCFNDQITIGVYRALRELNLSIPDDVGVVGFDNQELIAPELDPPLTTLELPHYEMGRWAVEHLLNLLEQPADEDARTSVQHLIDCPFIERVSV